MRKRMCIYICGCDWVTLLYGRKLTEPCKPTIMEKIKIIKKFISLLPLYFCWSGEIKEREKKFRLSCCGAVETNLTSIHDNVGSIPGLDQWVGVRHPALP